MRRLDNGTTILPQWEDPNNKKGGCWSFKIDNTQAQGVWYNLCKFLIGETVCKRKLDQMTINGISISPRNVYDKEKAFCIIKIWNSDCRQNDISVLSDELNFLHLDEFKYNSHNENIERDAAKVTRYKERMRERENQRGGRGHGGGVSEVDCVGKNKNPTLRMWGTMFSKVHFFDYWPPVAKLLRF